MATKDVELRLVISAINKAGAEIGRVGEQLRSVSARAKDLATSSAAAGTKGAAGMKKFGLALDRLKPKLEAIKRASDQMVSAGMQIGQVGAGLMASVVFPVLKAASFEKAMSNVKAVTVGTAAEFAILSGKAKTLGATTEWTAKQVAEAMEFLGMAGMDAATALDAIEPSLLLASAGGLELAQAADIATNILKGLNLETSELVHVTDVLAFAASNANTTVGQLGEAFSYVSGFVRSAGMNIEMAASMLGVLADAGVRSTRGGTALRGIILGLAKVTPLAAKAFDRLGVTISKNSDGTIDYVKTLVDLQDAGATTRDWADIFTRSFGAFASTLALNEDQLRRNAKAMEDVNGVAKEMAETRLANLWGAWKLVTSAVDGLSTAMGDPLLGPLKKVLKYLAGVISATTEWAKENSAVAGTFTAVIGGLGGFLTVLAAVLISLGMFGKLIGMTGSGLLLWPKLLDLASLSLLRFRLALMSTSKAALLLKPALLAIGVIWALKEIYDAVKAFVAWRREAAKMKVVLQDLHEQGSALVEKFGEFKDIEPPKTKEGFVGKTKEQLNELNEELIKAHLYWRGIKTQLEARAQEKTFWGSETEGAKAARLELAQVNVKLKEFRFARGEIFKEMKKAPLLSADDFLSPEELKDLRSDILETMDDVAKGISESISQSFAAVDTDPMIRRLEAAQLEISRNADMSGQERERRSKEIETDIADARLAIIRTSLGEALAAWDKHGEKLLELSRVSFRNQIIDDKEYGARTIAIMENVAEKKMQALAKVSTYLESALNKSLAAERKYAQVIKGIQEDIADFYKTAQDKIRELQRRGMSEEAAYADKVKELNEKLAEARALDPSQYERAKELFRDVRDSASNLVGEIKRGDQVLITEQKTIKASIGFIEQATEGLTAAGQRASTETAARLKEQKEVTQNLIQSLDAVAAKFDFLAQQLSLALELKLHADTTEIDSALTKMKGLEEEKSWCDQLFDEPIVVGVDTGSVADIGEAVQTEARKVAESPISVELEDNVQDVEANIEGALERVHQAGESIPVDLSTVTSIEELDRLAQEVYMVQEETGKPLNFVGISTGDIEASIQKIGLFKSALAELKPEEHATVDVEVTGTEEVDGLTWSISQVEDKSADVAAAVTGTKDVTDLAKAIGKLKDTAVAISVRVAEGGGLVAAAAGGLMPDSTWSPTPAGRKVPGAGTKDSVLAMLAPKEYVLCADAVREYGLSFVQSINRRMLDLGAFHKLQIGGSVTSAVKTPPQRLVRLNQMLPSMEPVVGGAQSTTVNRKDFNINISMNGGRAPKLSGRARRLLDQLSDEMDILATRGANFG